MNPRRLCLAVLCASALVMAFVAGQWMGARGWRAATVGEILVSQDGRRAQVKTGPGMTDWSAFPESELLPLVEACFAGPQDEVNFDCSGHATVSRAGRALCRGRRLFPQSKPHGIGGPLCASPPPGSLPTSDSMRWDSQKKHLVSP